MIFCWWARQDSNLQPDGYEPLALTIELQAPPGGFATAFWRAVLYPTWNRRQLVSATPERAVETLIALHDEATSLLRASLERFLATRAPPTPAERSRFRYPQLTVTYEASGPAPALSRAYA